MLNYLDGVAIGIYQGLYIEGLARDHLQSIVKVHVDRYLKIGMPKRLSIDPQNYWYIAALEQRWSAISQPHFRDEEGWLARWRRRWLGQDRSNR
jgi:hypothetical protein